MGNNVKGSFLAMMAVPILLFSYEASAFRATTMNNSSASQCSASGLEECPLANLVVFADPQTSLKGPSLKLTGISNYKKATPNAICGRPARPGQPYNPCIPNPNDIKKAEHCKTIYKDNNRNRLCT